MMTFTQLARDGVKDLAVYEPGRPIEEVARDLGFEDAEQIHKLASNENPLGPSPAAVKAITRFARQMHRYPDGGSFYLRHAIAKKLKVDAAQLLPGCGSNELIELLGHAFLGPDAGIVMADRAFVVYRLVAESFNAPVVMVPMVRFTHDLDAMLQAIRPDTRIVFISNPNNPTGTMVDMAAIDAFMARVPEHVIVCFDEAYIELLDPAIQPDVLKYVREGRKVVVLRTFSKTYGLAGLRIGYAVAPEECIGLMNRVRQPFNVSAMAMEAAVAALDDDEFVARTRRAIEDGLHQLQVGFTTCGLDYVPSVANFVLVNVGQGRKVFESMLREGVIVRPMDAYGLPEYIRITVGTDGENQKCLEALSVALSLSGKKD